MKKSIFIATFILLVVVGWIGSGQFTNVNAQDDTTSIQIQILSQLKKLLLKIVAIKLK